MKQDSIKNEWVTATTFWGLLLSTMLLITACVKICEGAPHEHRNGGNRQPRVERRMEPRHQPRIERQAPRQMPRIERQAPRQMPRIERQTPRHQPPRFEPPRRQPPIMHYHGPRIRPVRYYHPDRHHYWFGHHDHWYRHGWYWLWHPIHRRYCWLSSHDWLALLGVSAVITAIESSKEDCYVEKMNIVPNGPLQCDRHGRIIY